MANRIERLKRDIRDACNSPNVRAAAVIAGLGVGVVILYSYHANINAAWDNALRQYQAQTAKASATAPSAPVPGVPYVVPGIGPMQTRVTPATIVTSKGAVIQPTPGSNAYALALTAQANAARTEAQKAEAAKQDAENAASNAARAKEIADEEAKAAGQKAREKAAAQAEAQRLASGSSVTPTYTAPTQAAVPGSGGKMRFQGVAGDGSGWWSP